MQRNLLRRRLSKYLRTLTSFRGKSSFYTWAFRIAVNLTLNHCRRHARVGFRSLDDEEGGVGEQTSQVLKDFLSDDKVPDPANVARDQELTEIVMSSLMKLDEDHRTVIVLRDLEGMSYAQIAKVLEIELGTVRSRLSRARNSFREILEAVLR